MPDPCIAEAMVSALAAALVREGALSPEQISKAAAALDREGGATNEEAAHLLRCAIVEAQAEPEAPNLRIV